MSNTVLYALWGALYALCAGLGFIGEPSVLLQILMTAASVALFVPPLMLSHRAAKAGDRRTLELDRNFQRAAGSQSAERIRRRKAGQFPPRHAGDRSQSHGGKRQLGAVHFPLGIPVLRRPRQTEKAINRTPDDHHPGYSLAQSTIFQEKIVSSYHCNPFDNMVEYAYPGGLGLLH